jgi:hypothetical protein
LSELIVDIRYESKIEVISLLKIYNNKH